VQVDRPGVVAEHPVFEPVGLVDPQPIAGVLEAWQIPCLVRGIRDHERNVDDRLRGQSRNGGRADVLDPQRAPAEGAHDAGSVAAVDPGPARVVLGELDRSCDSRGLADRELGRMLLVWLSHVWMEALHGGSLPLCNDGFCQFGVQQCVHAATVPVVGVAAHP
jgi:hypothetical protein